MVELLEFTYREAIDLILDFYSGSLGVWKEELEERTEVKKIAEIGGIQRSKENDAIYKLSEKGEQILHEYIKDISEQFIEYMKDKGFESLIVDVPRWFKEKFDLESNEDGKEIAEYICKNLQRYGYKCIRCYSCLKEQIYKLEND